MKLIVGLGNPEQQYTDTRHNVGFRALASHAQQKDASFLLKDKFKSQIAEFAAGGEKVILALPMTYYNLSGEAIRAISDFYKIDSADVLVIHDELALPFGTIRTRIGGSDAGNNGVKSVHQHIGFGFARIRIGIWNELRDKMDDADFVLSKFSSDESEKLKKELIPKVNGLIDEFIAGHFPHDTHKL